MADTDSREGKQSEGPKRARAVFPRLALARVLELAAKLYEMGQGDGVRRRAVFDELGKSPESGASRMLVTAANSGYGLTTGTYKSEKLGLTPRGIAVTSGTGNEKNNALLQALFSNSVFSGFVDKYQDKTMPIDVVALDYLKDTYKLNDSDSLSALSVIKENLREFGLIEMLSGKEVIKPRETIDLELTQLPPRQPALDDGMQLPPDSTDPHGQHPQKQLGGTPEFHFNIQIHLPENASPESYDAMFASMAKHLLGRESDD